MDNNAKTYDELLELICESQVPLDRAAKMLTEINYRNSLENLKHYGPKDREQNAARKREKSSLDQMLERLVLAVALTDIIIWAKVSIGAFKKKLKHKSGINPEKKSEYNDTLDS